MFFSAKVKLPKGLPNDIAQNTISFLRVVVVAVFVITKPRQNLRFVTTFFFGEIVVVVVVAVDGRMLKTPGCCSPAQKRNLLKIRFVYFWRNGRST